MLVFASCLVCVFFDGDDVAGFLRALPGSFEGTRHNLTMTWPTSEGIPDELRPKDQILKVSRESVTLSVSNIYISTAFLNAFGITDFQEVWCDRIKSSLVWYIIGSAYFHNSPMSTPLSLKTAYE